jgi:hypothetical protein
VRNILNLQGRQRESQTSGKRSKPECGKGSMDISWGGSPKQANGREEKSERPGDVMRGVLYE